MSRLGWALLAGLPGVVLALLALEGWVPTARDGPSYFVPLRSRTAQVLRGEKTPWWNEDVGCGEAFFANPQSALLYPPAWWAAILPPERAVGVEVGCHLAFLGLGLFWLCRRLGGAPIQALAAAWGGQLCGPVLSAAGMLNNLETGAWLPWVWWASLSQRPRLLAGTVALSFLAAEPTLALGGAFVAFWVAPHRRTARALALGVGLAAVQLVPMVFWIALGDRGLDKPLEAASAGGIPVGELPALFIPGFSSPEVEVRFLPVITLPAWVLLGAWGLRGGGTAHRRLFLGSLVFLGLSVLPTLPWGDALWEALSFGLVRFPGRFAVVASLGFLAWAGSQPWVRTKAWLLVAVGTGFLGLATSRRPLVAVAQAVAVGAAPWAPPAALLGSAVLPLTTAHVLALARWAPSPVPCLEAQGNHRVFTLPVDAAQRRWARDHEPDGPQQLAWGYSVLLDGRRMVRSHGPLRAEVLSRHLQEADTGPNAFWWVSALGASRILALGPVAGYPVVCREGGLWVMANPGAFPRWGLVRQLPKPGELPDWLGEVSLQEERGAFWRFQVKASQDGFFLWLFTPDPGWFFRVDGQAVVSVRGVGILQGVPVPEGEHWVEVRYRPPGLPVGLAISLLSLLGVAWQRWW